MSRRHPTSQRLRPPSPWIHPPWIQIASPRLPMSLMEAAGVQARARCVLSPCLGRRNGAHRKIARRAEHRSWMAAARLFDATTNRRMVSAGGGAVERRFERAERRGGGRLSIVSGGEWSEEKNKIERAAGTWISMAPTAWDNATTNQKLTSSVVGYIWERQRAGR